MEMKNKARNSSRLVRHIRRQLRKKFDRRLQALQDEWEHKFSTLTNQLHEEREARMTAEDEWEHKFSALTNQLHEEREARMTAQYELRRDFGYLSEFHYPILPSDD